jgi:hypothetical protein
MGWAQPQKSANFRRGAARTFGLTRSMGEVSVERHLEVVERPLPDACVRRADSPRISSAPG